MQNRQQKFFLLLFFWFLVDGYALITVGDVSRRRRLFSGPCQHYVADRLRSTDCYINAQPQLSLDQEAHC